MAPNAREDEPTVEYRMDADSADEQAFWPGAQRPGRAQVIAGRYRLERRLGAGSSAQVWVAHDERLDRDVAIKILRDVSTQGGAERQRLRREAHVLAHLDHPRITDVYDLIEDADAPDGCAVALVTELLAGEDLAARLTRGPLALDEALDLCGQVADALGTAHRAGVIHRDVKPANVMLTANGVRLLDFGIARTNGESELTGASAIGTPACMAPEQWLGRRPEPATDVYALGCLLYWCLAGHAPFAENAVPALAMAHLELEPPALPERGQSSRVDALYRACVAKAPQDRPSAETVAAQLDPAVRAESPQPAEPAPRRVTRWQRASPRSRATIIVSSGCLCAAAALAIPLAVSSSASQPTSSGATVHSTRSATASPSGSKAKSTPVPASSSSNGSTVPVQATATAPGNSPVGPPPGQGDSGPGGPPPGHEKSGPPGHRGK